MQLLQELVGIKKYKDLDLMDLLRREIAAKKIKVKNGSFSVVVVPEDKDFVYRIWTQDGGWMEYMEYCLDHQDNPHVLKLKSRGVKIPFIFKRPDGFETTLYVIKTEKLTPVMEDLDLYGQVLAFSNIIARNGIHRIPHYKYLNQLIKDESGVEKDFDKSFYDTVLDLIETARYHIDIGTSNVMLRGKTLVLSDPIAELKVSIPTASDIIINKSFTKRR